LNTCHITKELAKRVTTRFHREHLSRPSKENVWVLARQKSSEDEEGISAARHHAVWSVKRKTKE